MGGKIPMIVGFVLELVAVICQGIAFATPGWTVEKINDATEKIDRGLWLRCAGDSCNSSIKAIANNFSTLPRNYDAIDVNLWVTQSLGLVMLFIAMIMGAFGSCCLSCCKGKCGVFAKYFILVFSYAGAMSILIGVVSFGTVFSDRKRTEPYKSYKTYELYYSYGLAVAACIVSLVAGTVTLFSTSRS